MSNSYIDTYKLKGMRKRLAEELKSKGKFDDRIIEAIENLPRHFFLDSAFGEQAYEDKAFPIQEGQTISQPYTVAYQTQLLDVQKGDKILEIGTGSGYQTCVLAYLGAKVYSIERMEKLSAMAKEIIHILGYHAKLFVGDGTMGLPKNAPFDKILVTAAAPVAPEQLQLQLKIGGFLVIPVGDKEIQQMIRITRLGENNFKTETFDRFRFVPLIGKEGW